MQSSAVHALQQHRPTLRKRWEDLLRAERVTSAMAHPDSLVHLMDWTLDRLFEELRHPSLVRHDGQPPAFPSSCECGLNPLLTYFATAEQAILETLLAVIEACPDTTRLQRAASLEEWKRAFDDVACHEISSFCAVCQHHKPHRQTRSVPA